MLLGESVKNKILDYQESNKAAANKAKMILDQTLHEEEKHGPASMEDVERYEEIARSLNKYCYGAVDIAQTWSFLAMHMLKHSVSMYKEKKSLVDISSLNGFMIAVSEKVYTASSDAVIIPDKIKIVPIQKSKFKYRWKIKKSSGQKIEGLSSGIDLRPNSLTVCSLFEVHRRFFTCQHHRAGLPYILKSNEFIKISLSANKIYAPLSLVDCNDNNPLGIDKKLWLVSFEIQKEMISEIDQLKLTYMSENESYRFIGKITNPSQVTEKFIDEEYDFNIGNFFLEAHSKNRAKKK